MNRDEIKATIDIYRQALIDNKRVEINVMMVDPSSSQTIMWNAYEVSKTSQFNYFKTN